MKLNALVMAGAIALAGVSGGCASRSSKPVYQPSQTGTIIREQRGEIVSVRDVVIAPADRSTIYGGPGRQIGTAVGRAAVTGSIIGAAAAIGGVVGGELGSKADQQNGEEITIRLAGTDEVIIVVQERGERPLAPGERVRVQIGGPAYPAGILSRGGAGNVRVVRDDYFAGAPLDRRDFFPGHAPRRPVDP